MHSILLESKLYDVNGDNSGFLQEVVECLESNDFALEIQDCIKTADYSISLNNEKDEISIGFESNFGSTVKVVMRICDGVSAHQIACSLYVHKAIGSMTKRDLGVLVA